MPRVKLFDQQEVLKKAMQLFWKQGYAATSVQDLVDHLGINRGSIYDTFGDKEKLFLKAFEHYRITNTQGMVGFLKTQPNVKEGLKQLFTMAIEQSATDVDNKGCFVVNTTTELIPGDEKITDILTENRKAFEQIFYDYLIEGESQGQIPEGKNLQALATLLFTQYNGLRVVSKVNKNTEELHRSIQQLLGILD